MMTCHSDRGSGVPFLKDRNLANLPSCPLRHVCVCVFSGCEGYKDLIESLLREKPQFLAEDLMSAENRK